MWMLEHYVYKVLCKICCHTLCSFYSVIKNVTDYYERFFDDRSVWGNISISISNQQVDHWCNGYSGVSDHVVKLHRARMLLGWVTACE